jgi:hypothetical protein
MVAKLPNVQNVKKAEIRQTLRCKLNFLRFSKNKPGYDDLPLLVHHTGYFDWHIIPSSPPLPFNVSPGVLSI